MIISIGFLSSLLDGIQASNSNDVKISWVANSFTTKWLISTCLIQFKFLADATVVEGHILATRRVDENSLAIFNYNLAITWSLSCDKRVYYGHTYQLEYRFIV